MWANGGRRGWSRSDEGATAAEYAIMASLIAVVIIVAVAALGSALGDSYDCTATHIGSLTTESPGDVDC